MNNAKKTLLLLLSLFFSLRIFFAQTLPFRHYSDDEGMPDVYVKCIYQDSKGYLWFGTLNGVSRFDGREFRDFNLEDGLLEDSVWDILEDRNGNIWVGTLGGGVSRIGQGKLENFTTRDGLVSMRITTMAADKNGVLWIGTTEGVSRFDVKREQFSTYTETDGLVSNKIFNIMEARDGSLWFGTLNGLSCFHHGHFVNYTTATGLINNNIDALIQDSKGRIWIGTENGLNYLEKGKFFSYTRADGLAGNMVLSAVEDQYGNIWLGTDHGLSRFSKGEFSNITTQNGLPSNAILSLLADREGNLWIGTTAGASCLHSLAIINYSVKDGLPNNMVWTILEDRQGRYWIGTEDGLSRFFKGKFKNYTTSEGLVNNRVGGLMEDRKGNIWIATDGGMSVYTLTSGRFINYTTSNGLLSNIVTAVFEDRKGITWIGTRDGLNRFSNGECVVPYFNGSPLGHYIRQILEDREGNLWLPTTTGLYRLSSTKEQLTCLTTENGLPHSHCYSVLEDSQGNIWIGTKRGLSCLKQGKLITFTTRDGLPDNKCYFILEDLGQNLWIGTSKGIARYDGDGFKIYTQEDGLPARNLSSACLRDSQGNLWFGSVNGVTRLNPALDRDNFVPPPVYITRINVLEEDVPLSESHRWQYNQNYLKFGFVGLCFKAPGSVRYRYRLEGLDNEWRETQARSVSYPYLPSGDYRFLVKAVNNHGFASPEPAEIQFKILPPFWKTWWFMAILTLVLLLMVVLVFLWRTRRVKEKTQLVMAQRMEIIGMLAIGAVHDLRDLLSVILSYSKMAEKDYTRSQDGQKQPPLPIEKIKKTAGTAIQLVKKMLAFSKQKHEYTADVNLVDVLKDILDILNIIRPPEVKISWEPPREEIRYRINPIHFKQVVMNLFLNANKAMPKGGELKISLGKTPGKEIKLVISDTGSGIERDVIGRIFDPHYTTKEQGKGTGLGLFVVKHIVEEYGGKISVQSEPGKGSQFLITFPPLSIAAGGSSRYILLI